VGGVDEPDESIRWFVFDDRQTLLKQGVAPIWDDARSKADRPAPPIPSFQGSTITQSGITVRSIG
jgi:hypothetical protein